MKTLIIILVVCASLTLLPLNQTLYALCGDADGSGSLDISDGVYIITYIFDGGPPPTPDPIENGDANNDGAVDISDAVYIIDFIFGGGPAPCAAPSGYLVDYSNCKNFNVNRDTITSSDDCLIWEYDGNSLLLTHVNAGLNCCTYKAGDITIENNEITIDVVESGLFCYCLCLFDLTYEIIPLPSGIYHIIVIEPFKPANDTALEVTIDLTYPTIDTFCVS